MVEPTLRRNGPGGGTPPPGRWREARAGDPRDLAEVGWAVVFAAADREAAAVREALRPLLQLRREQACRDGRALYRELCCEEGYRRGESKQAFLARHGVGPGPVEPGRMPYYLLLVGDPESLPYSFQYQLDVQYAVGRVWFETLEEYRRYARSVVAAERGMARREPRVALFAPRHPDDPKTAVTVGRLARPLADWLAAEHIDWTTEVAFGDDATRPRLGRWLGGDDTPALLFTAGHGLLFPGGHPRQRPFQGALVCREWPGPRAWSGPIPVEQAFSADDVGDDASPHGLIAFHFACYSAGTPADDDFCYGRPPARLAPQGFLARLPQRLLGHPRGGALAVVGHVERAWECSIEWPETGQQTRVFEDALDRLLAGYPIGAAMQPFGARYAELSSDLSVELAELLHGRGPDETALAAMWTACNDARNFTVVGDPAVRLVATGAASLSDRAQ
ncbi:MAG TPA: hypothetical protein VF121_12985 [Thermoanaerobaculia bacterium]|nr:hypothetical protein [Thermoanaerobaculia bacterium]